MRSLLCSFLFAAVAAAQPQSLTTLFSANNGGSSGWVVMFDVTVNPSGGVVVTGLDVNCSALPTAPVTVNLFTTPVTYLGNERNAAVWTKVASGVMAGAARNTPAFVDLADVVLPAGVWGLAVQTVGIGQAYTNGTGANQTYADANLSLSLGAALSTEFLSTGSLFTPRVWNGAIYYATRGDAVAGVTG